ncbi:hypothetical protein ACN47E_009397 [Coniothyrium glycines]
MLSPYYKDGYRPIDAAIGLSLLISEITAAPFGGGVISFSESPEYISLASSQEEGLVDTVRHLRSTAFGLNTNFVAIFEDVILPMAIKNKQKQEDMVKQIFVFSDMQFDAADHSADRWTTSYERIKEKYRAAGYQVSRLVFWNLAVHSTSKPTTMEDANTALVKGYSQGMLRAFLESGAFEDEEEEEEEEDLVKDEEEVVEDEEFDDGNDFVDEEEFVEEEVVVEAGEEGLTKVKKVKKNLDPLSVVRKAVGLEAYDMLEVAD